MTAAGREPNYNTVIERASAILENMFIMHINQSTLRSNANSMTSLEAFFRQKPDLKYIRIFGCICFALFHPSEHAHLSPRAKRGIFSGLRWSKWPR